MTDRFPFESVSAGAGAGREKTRRERKPARETGPAGPPAQEPRRWRLDFWWETLRPRLDIGISKKIYRNPIFFGKGSRNTVWNKLQQ